MYVCTKSNDNAGSVFSGHSGGTLSPKESPGTVEPLSPPPQGLAAPAEDISGGSAGCSAASIAENSELSYLPAPELAAAMK